MIDTSFSNNMQMMMLNLITKLLEKQTAEDASSYNKSNSSFADIIQQVSEKYGIDEQLIYSVFTSGSELSTTGSISSSSSSSLIQLLTDSSSDTDTTNALSSIYGGSGYLQTLLGLYNGDIEQTLETYNSGTDAVNSYSGISSYSGSQSYISKILEYYLGQQGKEA
jgi:soluble lytic murein transglycosylase-like protein